MFDWSGKNADKSGKSQGILISCVSGNPVYLANKNYIQRFRPVTFKIILASSPLYDVFLVSPYWGYTTFHTRS